MKGTTSGKDYYKKTIEDKKKQIEYWKGVIANRKKK